MGRGKKEEGSTISIHWAVAVKKRERKFHSLSLLLLSRAISPPSISPPTPSPKRTIQPVVSLSHSLRPRGRAQIAIRLVGWMERCSLSGSAERRRGEGCSVG